MVGRAKQEALESMPSLSERGWRFVRQLLGLAPCAELGDMGLELGPAALVELAGHIELAHRQLAAAAAVAFQDQAAA